MSPISFTHILQGYISGTTCPTASEATCLGTIHSWSVCERAFCLLEKSFLRCLGSCPCWRMGSWYTQVVSPEEDNLSPVDTQPNNNIKTMLRCCFDAMVTLLRYVSTGSPFDLKSLPFASSQSESTKMLKTPDMFVSIITQYYTQHNYSKAKT